MSSSTSEENAIDAAVLELTTCLEAVQTSDLAYATCIMNTGLFELVQMPIPSQPSEQEALGNRTAWFESQLSSATALGNCRLMCSAPTTIASSSSCKATVKLHECQLTPALVTEQLTSCKRVFDRGFQFTHECSGVSSSDVGLVVTTTLMLAAVFAIAVSARPQLNGYSRELQKVTDTSDSQLKVLELRLARSPRWKALLTAWRQITNLVWKNLLIKQRRPVALVIEQFLPVLLSTGLVLLANLDSFFGSASSPSSTTTRTYQASTNETEIFCMNYTVSDLADLGGPNSTMSAFYSSGQAALGMFFLITYIKFVSSTTTSMVLEKETRIREVMKIMGLSDFTLLCSWCLTSGILSTPLAFAIAAQLKFGNVFPTTELGTLVFLFWSLSVAIVAFSYFMTPFFHKSRAAAVVSVLLWLVLFFPFYAVQSRSSHLIKFWAALSPPMAFGFGIDSILRYAQLGTGFAYSLGIQKNPIDVPSALSMSWMLLLDSLLLTMAGWYLEQVVPQKFGVCKPWNFFFTRAYWMKSSSSSDDLVSMHSHTSVGRVGGELNKVAPTVSTERSTLDLHALDSGLTFKSLPEDLPPSAFDKPENNLPRSPPQSSTLPSLAPASTAITVEPVSAALTMQEARGECLRIRGLRKVFPSSHGGSSREDKVAVAGLDLTLYNGQITALLGHNGAGKTTIISMLTGLIPPTAGNATMFGRSIRRDMDQLRRIIGICPQHDVLFDDLTVEEHLQFFGTMKHVPPQLLDPSVTKILEDVGLADARHSLARTLSGGQKRKLSVAIAFIGDSKLVFLDEPTSGMDPYSRRFTWNLLQKSRSDRVIVLTTHFMDEADILGDRIAIVSDGSLHCAGTSLFLKARFGAGYNLTAIKTRAGDPKAIVAFLQRFVPGASCVSDYGSELVFQLPTATAASASGSSATVALPNMLEALEENMEALGVEQYGISATTLEQVFLRIARDRECESASVTAKSGIKGAIMSAKAPHTSLASLEAEQSVPSPSFRQQLTALTIKRIQIARRDRKTLMNSVGVPLFFLAIMIALPRIQIADFLQRYEQVLPTVEQQETCSVEAVDMSLLAPRPLKSCLGSKNFRYCELGVISCNATQCCDAAHYTSPWFPCNNCKFWPTTLPTDKRERLKYRCYNRECLKKPDAKLQVTLNAFLVAFIVMLAFAFIPAAIVAFVVREKDPAQNAKVLQLISGTSVTAYWLANWLHDAAVTSAPVALAVVAIPLAYAPLQGQDETLGIALLVVSHALASISLAYLLSRRFTRHAVAQTMLLVLGVGVGGLLSIFSFLCRVVDFRFSPTFSLAVLDRNYLRWLFLLVPGYALNSGIYEIATRKLSRRSIFDGAVAVNATTMAIANPPSFFGLFDGLGSPSYSPNSSEWCVECWESNTAGCCMRQVFDVDVAAAPIGYAFGEVIVFTVLLFLLEHREITWRRDNRKKNGAETLHLQHLPHQFGDVHQKRCDTSPNTIDEDEDVTVERSRVAAADPHDSLVMIRNLHHQFNNQHRHSRPKVAIQDLCLAIPPGECFGYLGINGAGKSTTMKVLTAQLAPTSGFVTLGGFDLATEARRARGVLGYCPQFDALHDLLTVLEQLTLYARLKGVPERDVAVVVHEIMERVDLMHSRNKLTCTLSGGNKRKVSTAIALLGDPRVILLDEPSTGVDAGARRKLWNVIAAVVAKRQACVVLTTHSMEECEALSTRVGVLVNGALQCLGSIAHLKHKFGRGYTVKVKLGTPYRDAVERVSAQIVAFLTKLHRHHPTFGNSDVLQVTRDDLTKMKMRAAVSTADSRTATATSSSSNSSSARTNSGGDGITNSSALSDEDLAVADARATKIIRATGFGWYIDNVLRTNGAVPVDAFATWWAAEDQGDALREFFRLEFPGSELVEQQDELFRFQVPKYMDEPVQGAAGTPEVAKEKRRRRPHEVFRALERATQRLNVSEYGVSDTSLEHIFNSFAARQPNERGAGTKLSLQGDK